MTAASIGGVLVYVALYAIPATVAIRKGYPKLKAIALCFLASLLPLIGLLVACDWAYRLKDCSNRPAPAREYAARGY